MVKGIISKNRGEMDSGSEKRDLKLLNKVASTKHDRVKIAKSSK